MLTKRGLWFLGNTNSKRSLWGPHQGPDTAFTPWHAGHRLRRKTGEEKDMGCQSVPHNTANEINWDVKLPRRLRKVHRAYMKISRYYDPSDSPGFVKLYHALHEYLSQPEPWRSEYEKIYAGVIFDE